MINCFEYTTYMITYLKYNNVIKDTMYSLFKYSRIHYSVIIILKNEYVYSEYS